MEPPAGRLRPVLGPEPAPGPAEGEAIPFTGWLGLLRALSEVVGPADGDRPDMRGCPPGLEARRHRINCREIVMRNLLALASGVRRTICWNLAPKIPGYENHLSVMDLLFGKLALLDYEGTELSRRHPAADTFALVAGRLTDVDSVVRVEVPGRPSLYLFEVRRRGRGPLLVVWDQRDSFSGEDDPPVAFDWPWPEARAAAVDAFGQPQPAEVRDGRVHLEASITPLLVTAG
ncbi:MAG TPA: hypothetical protein VI751_01365 [Actinomycetota bacterium]